MRSWKKSAKADPAKKPKRENLNSSSYKRQISGRFEIVKIIFPFQVTDLLIFFNTIPDHAASGAPSLAQLQLWHSENERL